VLDGLMAAADDKQRSSEPSISVSIHRQRRRVQADVAQRNISAEGDMYASQTVGFTQRRCDGSPRNFIGTVPISFPLIVYCIITAGLLRQVCGIVIFKLLRDC
jgi:hypothetical protein